MKKILSIVWYKVLPPEYGGQKGIAHFNGYLGVKVSLTCLCSRNNTADRPLNYRLSNELPVSRFQFWNPAVRKRVLRYIKENSYSHIIIEHPYHAWLGKYKKKYGFRFIVHAHNIEHLRMKARGKCWWRLIKRTERCAFRLADHILFKTETDKEKAINIFDINPEKCLVVPYGCNETEQPALTGNFRALIKKRHSILPEEKVILFAGTLDYGPNAKAKEIILKHIIPLLQKKQFRFRFILCGALPVKEISGLNAMSCFTATGFVPSLPEYLQAADVFINPVTTGSGVQTKNIDAIAGGCNVVTTAFASAGLPSYLVNKKLFVSPDNDWDHFTDNIIKASSLNGPVPGQFYKSFNWSAIIEKLLPAIAPED
ncbi:MAG: glycosyltransferase family 4 protein [Chitinophagaceae bacterium]|nr:glycosyltransferase family 4 protein [Chitinophagaceae bacterium]